MNKPRPSEVTPEHVYLSRRQFIKRTGILTLGAAALGACARQSLGTPIGSGSAATAEPAPVPLPGRLPTLLAGAGGVRSDELGNPVTLIDRVQTYGNYYEFTRNRMEVGQAVEGFEPPPLRIEVGGLVRKPGILDLDSLRELGEEERIYRMRCVEAWTMVVPWTGVPLNRLLTAVQPTSDARFVRFESVFDPGQMPGQHPGAYVSTLESDDAARMGRPVTGPYTWPYTEGLHLEEAMHELTLLATGMYGKPLHPVNGAPVRVVVPWKYAFKSIKAVTKIELVAKRPATFWNTALSEEYGFYGNVNPEVPHPRWEQVKEIRFLGSCPEPIVPSLMFNGYEDQVAHLYEGLDLRENY